VAVITFSKTTGQTSRFVASVDDYLLWYARNSNEAKFQPLTIERDADSIERSGYSYVEEFSGVRRRLRDDERVTAETKVFALSGTSSQTRGAKPPEPFESRGATYVPETTRGWSTTIAGLTRLSHAERLESIGTSLRYVRYHADFSYSPVRNHWPDVAFSTRSEDKVYAVQTSNRVLDRCILMTTDPGDLVFDPTCGSGTTAFCAERWGRRWITCDTSRVALTIARQRLMTARYDYYELLDRERGPAGGFLYQTVPHITLESIARNTEIDVIAAKYQPEIEKALAELNRALGKDWKEWEVPRELEAKWAKAAQEAHQEFWSVKRKKRQEIDASIHHHAPQETLYDRPQIKRGIVRVSGPYTVEAIPVPAIEDPTHLPAATSTAQAGAPIAPFEEEEARTRISDRGGDHLTNMVNLLKQQGGVLFPGGKKMGLQNLRLLNLGMLHAEGETGQNGKTLRVALSFGPQYGPISAVQANEAIQTAKLNAYEVLILAGFSIEAEAQAFVQKAQELVGGLTIHFANIAPDVLVGDLLKTTQASQIFTVFGQPDVGVVKQKDDTYRVELRGVDIYDPLTGETHHSRGSEVAAWFLDTDYDGMTFHLCQAFFPGDPDAWDRLQRALKAQIEPEAFEQMRGTVSFPFQPAKHERIAVKVLDFRGNEVVRVLPIGGVDYSRARG